MKTNETVHIEVVKKEVSVLKFLCRVFQYFIVKKVVKVYG